MKFSYSARKSECQETVPNSPENIQTFLEQLNTHPETISEAQNEPNGHFKNLDFRIFTKGNAGNAPGSTTSRVSTLIKNEIWALQNTLISLEFFLGVEHCCFRPHPDLQTASLALLYEDLCEKTLLFGKNQGVRH